ncbi:MAG: tetratricopeptide repeat protein [Thermoanaerobaculia bacterium]
MKIRTLLGILFALAVVVVAAYVSNQNVDLLTTPVHLTPTWSAPLYAVLIGVFLLGFLPTVGVLVAQTLSRELAARRGRRLEREQEGREGSLRRALDLHADGQWHRAIEEYERVLEESPEDFHALLRQGEALREAGRAADAVEVHRRASVLYPQSVVLLQQLADDYEAAGQPEVGREIRERILRDHEGVSLRVLQRRRNAALGAGDWAEAGALQERIERLLAGSADAALLAREESIRRGLAYQGALARLEAGQAGEAKRTFEELLAAEPQFIPARVMLGEAEELAGRHEQAVAVWRQGFAVTGSPVFLQRIEDHFIEGGDPVQAIECLRALIAAAGNDLLPRFFLGRLYYRLEMHDEALKILVPLEERIRSSPTYHLVLARIHERKGEIEEAAKAYSTSIREAGRHVAEYVCRICRARYDDWRDHCEPCRSWNSIELDFEEEQISPEALGVREAPVWGVAEVDEDL